MTPNPCIECNRHLKFDRFLRRARQLGFDAIATGHHARVVRQHARFSLRRGADPAKDQSYVLYVLGQDALTHTLFPVGAMTKADVRARAAALGLATADKPDSQDVCFVQTGGGRATFLGDRIPMRPGVVVDTSGAPLGSVPAVELVTVGQRRGLKLGRPAADGKPRFVLEIRPKENKVVVGPEALLAIDEIRGIKVSWAGLPIAEVESGAEFDCYAQVRAHGEPVPATARMEAGEGGAAGQLVIRLTDPLRGVAPGQTVVLYQGSRVLGQATIDVARSLQRAAL
jgi:tRNA-specific 2-thiouridylase